MAEETLDSRPLGPSTINADEIGVAYGLQLLKWFIIHKAYFDFFHTITDIRLYNLTGGKN